MRSMSSNLKLLLLVAIALTIVGICVISYQGSKRVALSTNRHLETKAQSQVEERQDTLIARKMARKERQQQKVNQGH